MFRYSPPYISVLKVFEFGAGIIPPFLPAAQPSGPRTVRVVVVVVVGGGEQLVRALASLLLYFGFINSLRGGIHKHQSASFFLLDFGYMNFFQGGIQNFFLSMAQFLFRVVSSVSSKKKFPKPISQILFPPL